MPTRRSPGSVARGVVSVLDVGAIGMSHLGDLVAAIVGVKGAMGWIARRAAARVGLGREAIPAVIDVTVGRIPGLVRGVTIGLLESPPVVGKTFGPAAGHPMGQYLPKRIIAKGFVTPIGIVDLGHLMSSRVALVSGRIQQLIFGRGHVIGIGWISIGPGTVESIGICLFRKVPQNRLECLRGRIPAHIRDCDGRWVEMAGRES